MRSWRCCKTSPFVAPSVLSLRSVCALSPAHPFFCNVPSSPHPQETPFLLLSSLGNGYAIVLPCPRSRQDRQLLLHLLASPTGESPSCALPWAASECKPHETRTIPAGGVQVQPPMLLHQGPSQARAARIQMGAGIWGCCSRARGQPGQFSTLLLVAKNGCPEKKW